MLLDQATSKEQVAAALEAGDEELRENIQEILDNLRRRWDNGPNYDAASDYESFDMKDIVESDNFIDTVILKSPSRYELAQIPREDVESGLLRAAANATRGFGFRSATKYGPFYIDERGGDHFSYKLDVGGNYTFPGSWFPKKAEFIPAGLAKEFWDSLGSEYTWGYTDHVDRNEDNYGYGPGTESYVEASESDFDEWCRDQVAEYVTTAVRRQPEKAKEIFFNGLAEEDKALAEKLKSAGLPDEEILDFATSWFQEGREDVLATVRDYFATLEIGTGVPHEVLAEFSKDDVVNMGIRKGVLFENAPWKLIKLHPSDLRLEGTLMGHCVGDKGMGYISAVNNGEIEIWSLRSRDNKPRFTLEVDAKFYRADDEDDPGLRTPELQTLTPAFYRARAIKQLKGKANRQPGYADVRKTGGIKFPDEVFFWAHALQRLGVNPEQVDDFDAFREEQEEDQLKLQANSGAVCTGFDMPYRPLLLPHEVAPNRRSSRRSSSRRRGSKRRSSRRSSRR